MKRYKANYKAFYEGQIRETTKIVELEDDIYPTVENIINRVIITNLMNDEELNASPIQIAKSAFEITNEICPNILSFNVEEIN